MLDYARKVDAGEIEDEAFSRAVRTVARRELADEHLWPSSIPVLAEGFPNLAGLRQLQGSRGADRVASEFCQFLNQWQEHSVSPFIEMDVYDRGKAPIDVKALEGRPCWIGVDMALRHDLCAIVAAFRDGDGYVVLAWFFTPEENLLAKADRDKVDYLGWSEAGFIIPTPGPVINHKVVAQHLRDLAERFDVQEINFDPNRALDIMHELQEDRLRSSDQSWRMLVPAIDTLTEVLLEGRLSMAGILLRWNFENIAMTRPDRNGNRLFSKSASRDRIDGASACLMAIQRASMGEIGHSTTGPCRPIRSGIHSGEIMSKRRRIRLAELSTYRNGPDKPVTLARIYRGEARRVMVGKIMDVLRDWRLSPLRIDGSTRAGMRRPGHGRPWLAEGR